MLETGQRVHWTTLPHITLSTRNKLSSPVVNAPVEAEVERAEFATFPHHFHHRLVVELRDVPQVQDTQVTQLQEATRTNVYERFNRVNDAGMCICAGQTEKLPLNKMKLIIKIHFFSALKVISWFITLSFEREMFDERGGSYTNLLNLCYINGFDAARRKEGNVSLYTEQTYVLQHSVLQPSTQ